MQLKNLMSTSKEIEVEHPAFEGWIVRISYISREVTKKLLDRATTSQFNSKTHQPEESVDNDLFLELYCKALVKGWKGLKLSYLPELLPVDFSAVEIGEKDELEYTQENALDLMKNAPDFDNWLSSVIKDVKNFNKSN